MGVGGDVKLCGGGGKSNPVEVDDDGETTVRPIRKSILIFFFLSVTRRRSPAHGTSPERPGNNRPGGPAWWCVVRSEGVGVVT